MRQKKKLHMRYSRTHGNLSPAEAQYKYKLASMMFAHCCRQRLAQPQCEHVDASNYEDRTGETSVDVELPAVEWVNMMMQYQQQQPYDTSEAGFRPGGPEDEFLQLPEAVMD